jgi:hypothetical protein
MERWAGSWQNIRVSSTGQADLAGSEGYPKLLLLSVVGKRALRS